MNRIVTERVVIDQLNSIDDPILSPEYSDYNGRSHRVRRPRYRSEFAESIRAERQDGAVSADEWQLPENYARSPLVRRSAPSIPDREAYGSNEHVYNPYQPFTSKEYIAQEIAAGRMTSAELTRDSPHASQNLHESFRKSWPRPPSANNEPLYIRTLDPAIWRSRMDTSRRDDAFPSLARITPELNRVESYPDSVPQVFEDIDPRTTLPRRHLCPSRSEGFVGFALRFTSDAEDQSTSINRSRQCTPDSNEPISSFDDLLTSTQQHLDGEGRSSPSCPVEMIERARLGSPRSGPELVSMQAFGGSADRKRRRADGFPEDPVLSGRTRGFPAACPTTAGTAAMQATTEVLDSENQSRLYVEAWMCVLRKGLWSESMIVGRWRDGLKQDLPKPVGLNIARYPIPHFSRSIKTSTPSIMGSKLPGWYSYRFGFENQFFTSECIPRSFSTTKRQELLDIFRTKAPYVPACIVCMDGLVGFQYHVTYKRDPFRRQCAQAEGPNRSHFGSSGRGWPGRSLPVEIFQYIASYLPQQDLKSMRLVNSEFEKKTSNILFHSVVVPFTAEIYGSMMKDTRLCKPTNVQSKSTAGCLLGRLKRKLLDMTTGQNSHDGITIFNAWGFNIKNFAVALEIQPDQLAQPPIKGKYKKYSTWWGPYQWPPEEYARYEYCSGLETKADEYPIMREAFSKLNKVQELGLCLDSGLGWLAGPDISDRAQLFQQKCKVFGSREAEEIEWYQKSQKTWRGIADSFGPQRALNSFLPSNIQPSQDLTTHVTPLLFVADDGHNGYLENNVECLERRPLVFEGVDLSYGQSNLSIGYFNLRDLSQGTHSTRFATAPVVPNKLTPAQKEWLLELQWAQSAFINSYCLAVADNEHTFKNVRSLNITKLPSNHLSRLQGDDIWRKLRSLTNLTIIVAADFRTIQKSGSGLVTTSDISPSEAVKPFFTLMKTSIANVKHIKTMRIGYFGGGEHQTGIFGRNRFVLPAPFADYSDENVFTNEYKEILMLPHVENLTLTNCWIAPPMLKNMISIMRGAKLRSLTLDSVSLTAHSGVTNPTVAATPEENPSQYPYGGERLMDDPHVPDGFFSQRHIDSDPGPGRATGWIYSPSRIGSWANVIDAISPGPTLDLVRYAFQYSNVAPQVRHAGALEEINFMSCGYVKLVNQTAWDQSCLPEIPDQLYRCLYARATELMPVMMHRNEDQLLGQIATGYNNEDFTVLKTGFPMKLGWGDNERRFDNLEDGQPEGGSGRFTGRVAKFLPTRNEVLRG